MGTGVGVGKGEGATVGGAVGTGVGETVGAPLGADVGDFAGTGVGDCPGTGVALAVGVAVGVPVGFDVGFGLVGGWVTTGTGAVPTVGPAEPPPAQPENEISAALAIEHAPKKRRRALIITLLNAAHSSEDCPIEKYERLVLLGERSRRAQHDFSLKIAVISSETQHSLLN